MVSSRSLELHVDPMAHAPSTQAAGLVVMIRLVVACQLARLRPPRVYMKKPSHRFHLQPDVRLGPGAFQRETIQTRTPAGSMLAFLDSIELAQAAKYCGWSYFTPRKETMLETIDRHLQGSRHFREA